MNFSAVARKILIFVGASAGTCFCARAQIAPPPIAPPPITTSALSSASIDPIADKKRELRSVEEGLGGSSEQRLRIEREIEALRADRARLVEAMMDSAARVEAADARLAATEKRLTLLTDSEGGIRRSLEARRGLIGEILAVLQRMGRRAPPALLVNPEDVVQAIRTSMTLGAVLPELRAETEALVSDLQELARLRGQIGGEREALANQQSQLATERNRLNALLDARQKSLGEAEIQLTAERRRAEELGRQATSLRDLISRMEADIAGAQKVLEEARRAEENRKQIAAREAKDQQDKIAASPFKDAARLAPAVAFSAMRGRAPMPAVGRIARTFGESDAYGGTEKGIAIATRPKAMVVAPADSWVVYAAPYRGYGQLLILNAGEGYYMVLAGMDKIHVQHGQFVLAGEPIAAMGDGSTKIASASAIGAGQPILYVEFRKDGSSIDPSPWWAQGEMKKVR